MPAQAEIRILPSDTVFPSVKVSYVSDFQVVVAYVTNGLKTGMGELTRTYRHLRNAVFECLEKAKEEAA